MDESELAGRSRPRCRSPGRTGTLHDRMRGTAARDALPGQDRHAVQRLRAGGLLRRRAAAAGVAFAFLMNYVYPWTARRLQDRMTAALARYDG